MVKIALVGCGSFAQKQHLRQYSALEDRVELVAFVDPDSERASEFRKRVGTGEVCRDISELPGPDGLDYVDVCVPHRFHLPIGLSLLKAGHNVLLEKPMALSTDECDQLIGAADHNHVRLGVGMHTRFNSSWVAVREFVRSGKSGVPLFASAAFNSSLASFHKGGGAATPWRGSAEGGGGALVDLGIYAADFFAWTFGDPLRVQAMRLAKSPSDPAGGQRGSEMTGFITAELKGGVVVSIQATWDYPEAKLPPALDDKGFSCRIVCERGVLLVADHTQGGRPAFYSTESDEPIPLEMPDVEPELSQVVSSAEKRDEFPVSGREGRRSVAFIEAALDSIASGRAVTPR